VQLDQPGTTVGGVLARVLTFSAAEGTDLTELVDALRTETSADLESMPGFRGLIVLERGRHQDVLTMTLWEDAASLEASDMLASAIMDRIARATRNIAVRDVYRVLGTIGIAGLEIA